MSVFLVTFLLFSSLTLLLNLLSLSFYPLNSLSRLFAFPLVCFPLITFSLPDLPCLFYLIRFNLVNFCFACLALLVFILLVLALLVILFLKSNFNLFSLSRRKKILFSDQRILKRPQFKKSSESSPLHNQRINILQKRLPNLFLNSIKLSLIQHLPSLTLIAQIRQSVKNYFPGQPSKTAPRPFIKYAHIFDRLNY